jgi:hypothetical protein
VLIVGAEATAHLRRNFLKFDNPETNGAVHVGFSSEALQDIADESGIFSSEHELTREAIKQFVVEIVAANNAALVVDFQVLSDQYDEMRARVEELEVLLGISEALSTQEPV